MQTAPDPDARSRRTAHSSLALGAKARVGADHDLLPELTPFSTRLALRFGLRVTPVELTAAARTELQAQLGDEDQPQLIAKTPCRNDADRDAKRAEVRRANAHLCGGRAVFLEVDVRSTTRPRLQLELASAPGAAYTVLKVSAPAAANVLAGALLAIRDELGSVPHIHFTWSEGNPLGHAARYLLTGRGDTAVTTREILRRAEPDRRRRPVVHVG